MNPSSYDFLVPLTLGFTRRVHAMLANRLNLLFELCRASADGDGAVRTNTPPESTNWHAARRIEKNQHAIFSTGANISWSTRAGRSRIELCWKKVKTDCNDTSTMAEDFLSFVHGVAGNYTTFLLNLLFSLCLCCFLASFLFFFHARLFSPRCS